MSFINMTKHMTRKDALKKIREFLKSKPTDQQLSLVINSIDPQSVLKWSVWDLSKLIKNAKEKRKT